MGKNIIKTALLLTMLMVMPLAVLAQKLQAVDLGLSVKWANMNVGASSSTEYGDYFAWGEVSDKRFYSNRIESKHIRLDYIDDSKANVEYVKYSKADGRTQLDLSDDVANQKYGKKWRMPTQAEMQELIDNCDWVLQKIDGCQGYLIKSRKNSNSIFMPLAGYKTGDRTKGTVRRFCSSSGYYWTSTFAQGENNNNAIAIGIEVLVQVNGNVGSYQLLSFHRTNGCVVRPVCD